MVFASSKYYRVLWYIKISKGYSRLLESIPIALRNVEASLLSLQIFCADFVWEHYSLITLNHDTEFAEWSVSLYKLYFWEDLRYPQPIPLLLYFSDSKEHPLCWFLYIYLFTMTALMHLLGGSFKNHTSFRVRLVISFDNSPCLSSTLKNTLLKTCTFQSFSTV